MEITIKRNDKVQLPYFPEGESTSLRDGERCKKDWKGEKEQWLYLNVK